MIFRIEMFFNGNKTWIIIYDVTCRTSIHQKCTSINFLNIRHIMKKNLWLEPSLHCFAWLLSLFCFLRVLFVWLFILQFEHQRFTLFLFSLLSHTLVVTRLTTRITNYLFLMFLIPECVLITTESSFRVPQAFSVSSKLRKATLKSVNVIFLSFCVITTSNGLHWTGRPFRIIAINSPSLTVSPAFWRTVAVVSPLIT